MNRCRGARALRAGELRTEKVDARRRSRDRADRVIGDGRGPHAGPSRAALGARKLSLTVGFAVRHFRIPFRL